MARLSERAHRAQEGRICLVRCGSKAELGGDRLHPIELCRIDQHGLAHPLIRDGAQQQLQKFRRESLVAQVGADDDRGFRLFEFGSAAERASPAMRPSAQASIVISRS